MASSSAVCRPIPSGPVPPLDSPLVRECYHRFLPGLKRIPGLADAALFYAGHAARAITQRVPIHLSRKRDLAPAAAEISPTGELFIAIRHSAFVISEQKKIKQAFDVLRNTLVARSVKPVDSKTQKRRASEEEARKALSEAPWMVKEFYYNIYSNRRILKQVVITEFFKDQDLFHFIKKHPPISLALKKCWIHQILRQLVDIHVHGIHKDLKTENVLLIEESARIAIFDFDFFCASTDSDKRRLWSGGTFFSFPPEYARGTLTVLPDYTDITTPAYDVWGAGLILGEIVYWNRFTPPWETLKDRPTDQLRCIAETDCTWLPDPHSQEPLHLLIRSMLEPDSKKRPTAAQALKYFEEFVLTDGERLDRGSPSVETTETSCDSSQTT